MKTKTISLILAITMLVFAFCITGCSKDAEFIFESKGDGTCSVSLYDKEIKEVEIPEVSPDGDRVTEVKYFQCQQLKSIVIPGSVQVIRENAFYCEKLEELTLSDGLTTIGRVAFEDCKALTEIVIPETVTTIEQGAFLNCTSLKSLVIGGGELEDGLISGCESLTSVTLGKNVSAVSVGVFSGAPNLESITVDSANEKYYSEGNCIITKEDRVLVAGCHVSVIPEGVRKIESRAFYGEGLTGNLSIPDSVEHIGGEAFGLTEITSVTIGSGLRELGGAAFVGCLNLTEVTIPSNVTYISGNAFMNCENLTSIEFFNKTGWSRNGSGYTWDFSNASWNASQLKSGSYQYDTFKHKSHED